MANLNQLNDKNICIIGLMGSGKTIIGKGLAKFFNKQHFDTDRLIEEKYKKSISQIFKDDGEKFFRKIEEISVLDILKKKNSVISLGGGSILSRKVREQLKQRAITIYLKVDISELELRLRASKKRPLINDGDLRENLKKIFESRKEFYNIANFIIENNFDSQKAISDIISKLK